MTEIRAEAIWATALAHPLRVRILRHLLFVHAAAPTDVARRWEIDASVMRRHFRRLCELGLLERVARSARYAPGAYRLSDHSATAEALWRLGAPMPARGKAERLAARMTTIESPRRMALERLRLRREQLGLSQPVLSRRAGLHSETVGRIERGDTDPRLSVLLVLADELCYPPDQLFTDTPMPHADTCR